MGLRTEEPVPGLDGAVYTAGTSELNQRTLYKRWAEFMDAEDWDELMHRR